MLEKPFLQGFYFKWDTNIFRPITMYSKHFRNAVMSYYHIHKSLRNTSAIFHVSKSSIHRWINGYVPKMRKSMFCTCSSIIINKVQNTPFITLEQIKAYLLSKKLKISITTIHKILKLSNLSYKRVKTKYYYKSLETLYAKQKAFTDIVSKIPNDKILCIDESYFDSNIKSNYAWSIKGKPLSHYKEVITKKQSLITIISNCKVLKYELYNGNINSARFLSFLSSVLSEYNDYHILMDNVRFHKTKEVTEYINNNNSVLYIPPYSPQFNPIEEVFSQLKSYLKKGLNIHDSVNKITPTHLGNYYSHMRKLI